MLQVASLQLPQKGLRYGCFPGKLTSTFLRSQSTLSSKVKMLKNMKVLLYTYFYNIIYIFCNTMSLRVRLGDCF